MKIEKIMQLNDPKKIIDKLSVDTIEDRNIDKYLKEYKGKHVILERLDKIIGEDAKTLADGTVKPSTKKIVKTYKLVLKLQKKIVRTTVAFLFGNPVNYYLDNPDETTKKAFEALKNLFRENKIDSFNKKLARTLFSESKTAELWYLVPKQGGEGFEIKVMILSAKNGDEFYPHFDEYGRMDAFTRKYSLKDEKGRSIEHVDIYTANATYFYIKSLSGNSYTVEDKKNPFGKIPVVYYDQEEPEWFDVQSLVDRLELLISKHADMNDYFSAPSVKTKGSISAAPSKEEVGKMFQINGEHGEDGKVYYGDIEYLVWEHSPESLKLEVENLKGFINYLTSTPDLSFANMKDIGTNLSGLAIKLMFLDSILKSYEKQEIFTEGFDRRINILREMIKSIDNKLSNGLKKMDVQYEYGSVLPENIKELIETLSDARPGTNLITEKTQMKHNPFINDADSEYEEMQKEKTQSLGGSYE